MAGDILKNIPLPADLTENWTSQQTVAPTGAEVGMDEQHGYNYLMKQVNNAQRALKALAAQREEDLARIKFWASNDPTSPASFIGGTWERIEGKFIMGASDTYPAGSTGGEAEHSHAYAVTYVSNYGGIVGGSSDYSVMAYNGTTGGNNIVASDAGTGIGNQYSAVSITPNQTIYYKRSLGRTGYETNMPPYYSVYIWRRVA